MEVLTTMQDDGVATMTVTFADDDHKFEVYRDGKNALVEYQETLSWRGQIRVAQPDDKVYRALMTSDEMTAFLERYNLNGVQRADPSPKVK
jgi:hypothetical protein